MKNSKSTHYEAIYYFDNEIIGQGETLSEVEDAIFMEYERWGDEGQTLDEFCYDYGVCINKVTTETDVVKSWVTR